MMPKKNLLVCAMSLLLLPLVCVPAAAAAKKPRKGGGRRSKRGSSSSSSSSSASASSSSSNVSVTQDGLDIAIEFHSDTLTEDEMCELGLYPWTPAFLSEFPSSLHPCCGRGLGIWQYPNQFVPFLNFLAAHRVRTYIEVGVAAGGTFMLMTEFLRQRNELRRSVAIDTAEMGELVYMEESRDSPFAGQLARYIEKTDIATFFHGDSRKFAASALARGDGPRGSIECDLVFIDGDHSYFGLVADMNVFSNQCTLIVLHDIVNENAPSIPEYWMEVQWRQPGQTIDFTAQYTRGARLSLGIGVIDTTRPILPLHRRPVWHPRMQREREALKGARIWREGDADWRDDEPRFWVKAPRERGVPTPDADGEEPLVLFEQRYVDPHQVELAGLFAFDHITYYYVPPAMEQYCGLRDGTLAILAWPIQLAPLVTYLSKFPVRTYVHVGVDEGGIFMFITEYLRQQNVLHQAIAVDRSAPGHRRHFHPANPYTPDLMRDYVESHADVAYFRGDARQFLRAHLVEKPQPYVEDVNGGMEATWFEDDIDLDIDVLFLNNYPTASNFIMHVEMLAPFAKMVVLSATASSSVNAYWRQLTTMHRHTHPHMSFREFHQQYPPFKEVDPAKSLVFGFAVINLGLRRWDGSFDDGRYNATEEAPPRTLSDDDDDDDDVDDEAVDDEAETEEEDEDDDAEADEAEEEDDDDDDEEIVTSRRRRQRRKGSAVRRSKKKKSSSRRRRRRDEADDAEEPPKRRRTSKKKAKKSVPKKKKTAARTQSRKKGRRRASSKKKRSKRRRASNRDEL